MKIRTYEAKTAARALACARDDFGPGVIILDSRPIRRGGMLGLVGASKCWQVIASQSDSQDDIDPDVNSGQYVSSGVKADTSKKTVLAVAALEAVDLARDAHETTGDFAGELAEIRQGLTKLLSRKQNLPAEDSFPAIKNARQKLLDRGVDSEVAKKLLSDIARDLSWTQLQDEGVLAERITESLVASIHTVNGNPPPQRAVPPARVIAVVGPTGVGKTTTVAKLASEFKLTQGLNVGLVTMDTYRIAAVDQLRTYSEILKIEMKTVLTPGEMSKAIHSMRSLDVVLVDTVGRSQHNASRLDQLKSFLDAAQPSETHLVISATASSRCAKEVVESFSLLGVNRVILSKLDEAANFGLAVNIPAFCESPLSYVTTGQAVPNDITKAHGDALAQWVVSGRPGGDSE